MSIKTQGGGSLPKDANSKPINVASRFQNRDNTTPTAQESPLTVAGTPLEIVIPDNAVLVKIRASGADLRIGDNSTLDGTAGKGYFLLPDGFTITEPVADGNSIYVMRNAAVSVTMSFNFEIL